MEFILTFTKDPRFIDTMWTLVYSMGTAARFIIMNRIFLALMSSSVQSIPKITLETSRL